MCAADNNNKTTQQQKRNAGDEPISPGFSEEDEYFQDEIAYASFSIPGTALNAPITINDEEGSPDIIPPLIPLNEESTTAAGVEKVVQTTTTTTEEKTTTATTNNNQSQQEPQQENLGTSTTPRIPVNPRRTNLAGGSDQSNASSTALRTRITVHNGSDQSSASGSSGSSTSRKEDKKPVRTDDNSNNGDRKQELYLKLRIVSQGPSNDINSGASSSQPQPQPQPNKAPTVLHIRCTSNTRVPHHKLHQDEFGSEFCEHCGFMTGSNQDGGKVGSSSFNGKGKRPTNNYYNKNNNNNKKSRGGSGGAARRQYHHDDNIDWSSTIYRFVATWILPPLLIVVFFIITDYIFGLFHE